MDYEYENLDMRVLSLVEELRSDNEIRQSEACGELSDMLLLGNEESLPNFPIRELVLSLIGLLQKDHNFELVCLVVNLKKNNIYFKMLSATRCITNLQEALPRSQSILVEAIPVSQSLKKRINLLSDLRFCCKNSNALSTLILPNKHLSFWKIFHAEMQRIFWLLPEFHRSLHTLISFLCLLNVWHFR